MKLECCKNLKKGDKVLVSLGGGEYQTMTFLRMVECISYGRTTIDEFLQHGFGKGRHVLEAEMEYINDYGGKDVCTFNTRRLIKKV